MYTDFTTTTNTFVCFLGEFEDTKKSFRNYPTFKLKDGGKLKTGDLKNWQTYFTTYKMVQMSNLCISNGLPMHQNFILKLFEPLGHIQFLYRTVLIRIYFFALLLWFFEFGRIFELCKMHWIYQNWLRILQYNSKIYFIICCQAFWTVKLSFENKFWYGLPAFVT